MIVVLADNQPVAQPEDHVVGNPDLRPRCLRRVQSRLERAIQRGHSNGRRVLGCEDLGVEPNGAFDNQSLRVDALVLGGWPGVQDVQIARRVRASHRELAVVDAMRSLDDGRALALALDHGQQRNRDAAAGNQVAQDGAWADTGQLVLVAHEDESRSRRQRPQ